MLAQLQDNILKTAAIERIVLPEALYHCLKQRFLRVDIYIGWDDRALTVYQDHGDDLHFLHSSEGESSGEGVAHQHSERVHVPLFGHIA